MNSFALRFLLLLSGLFVAGTCVFGLTAIATYKPYGVPESQREKWDKIQADIAEAQRLSRETPAPTDAEDVAAETKTERAIAFIDVREHDFGMLDPGGSATHIFEIRNDGTAPLVLAAGETSCKCTLSEVSKKVVQPGDSAEIALTWNTGSKREFYRQYAVIETNDPDQREIELAVTGQVKALVAFDSEELVVPTIAPGEAVATTTVLYSQSLPSFDIEKLTCGLPGFRYSSEPLVPSELEGYKATSGWRLRLSSDASLDQGQFTDLVRVVVASEHLPEDEKSVFRELPIRGKVSAPITFYGPGLHSQEGLNLGIISDGKEKVSKLLVRVRGSHVPEQLVISKIEPSILEADIEPLQSKPGVFNLTIRVPAGAAQTIFNREQRHGFVEVSDAENPAFSNWIPVHGAVISIE